MRSDRFACGLANRGCFHYFRDWVFHERRCPSPRSAWSVILFGFGEPFLMQSAVFTTVVFRGRALRDVPTPGSSFTVGPCAVSHADSAVRADPCSRGQCPAIRPRPLHSAAGAGATSVTLPRHLAGCQSPPPPPSPLPHRSRLALDGPRDV